MKRSKNIIPKALAVGVVLLLSVAGVWIFRFERRAREPVRLAASMARRSAEVRRLIGEPINLGSWTKGNLVTSHGDGTADLAISIHGPLGRGTLLEWAQEDAGKWRVCSLLLPSNDVSTSTTLVSDASTHCDRE